MVTYTTKAEILGVMQFFRPTYTEANISDQLALMATRDIHAVLYMAYITVPADDIGDMLNAAEICFYMEHSAMVRETEQAFGIIGQETIGNYTKKYENGMPMFFFAQGSSQSFLELLPHETWRMRAYKYVRAFIAAYTAADTTVSAYAYGVEDNTARGNGWDDTVSDWDTTLERL